MIKTYALTTPARNSSIVLRGKTNNSLRYNFTGGDPLTGKSASIMLRSQYAQDLLESSELFAKGYVKLVRTDEGGETPVAEPEKTIVEEVKSPEQLIEFVADKLEKVYQRPEAALNFAKSKGYEFPNLELKKKEE
jgi:hypothetical protein